MGWFGSSVAPSLGAGAATSATRALGMVPPRAGQIEQLEAEQLDALSEIDSELDPINDDIAALEREPPKRADDTSDEQFEEQQTNHHKALQKLHNDAQYLSVDFTRLDVARIAQGFGLKGLRAANAEELVAALDDADWPLFLFWRISSPTWHKLGI